MVQNPKQYSVSNKHDLFLYDGLKDLMLYRPYSMFYAAYIWTIFIDFNGILPV